MVGVWARRLRPATFRGVPFKVLSHEFSTGRNSVEHETPGQDSTYSEDMGKKTQVFSIDGHVIGDDYFRLRDNLIDACEQSGAGELVHPYLGTKTVQCKSFSFREDTQDGRRATFSIEFVEAGSPDFPTGLFDAIAGFFDAANNAVDAVKAAFDSVWDLTNVPGFIIDEALVLLDNSIQVTNDSLDKIRAIPARKTELEAKIQELKDRRETLVRNGSQLSTELGNTTKDLNDAPADPEETDSIDVESGRDDKITVLDDVIVLNDTPTVIETVTPSRQRQIDNEKAFKEFMQDIAVIFNAQSSVIKQYKTLEDALRQRERLIALLEKSIDRATDDAVFQTLSDLKGRVVITIPSESVILASEVTLDFNSVETSLTAVYDLTGSIESEADFISRNKAIRNPAFIEPGEYIAVNG